jgi:hypothetical protein
MFNSPVILHINDRPLFYTLSPSTAMEYNYSYILDPALYDTDGLCDGLLVRKHVAEDLEEIGTFRAQQDWRAMVAPLSNYKGGLGPRHSFMAVSMPECLPDRFEIVSYANEFAFLHDGMLHVQYGERRQWH